jgi:hypothetical protein
VSYSETFDSLCVLLEEYSDVDIETVANQILAMFGLLGEDLLDALDPPQGLQTWLRSHGLSLLTTSEVRSPRVWEALETQEDAEEEDGDLEEESSEELPLQVGEFVEYITAPHGPNHAQQIGAGRVIGVGDDHLWVQTVGLPDAIYIAPGEGDVIRRLATP